MDKVKNYQERYKFIFNIIYAAFPEKFMDFGK